MMEVIFLKPEYMYAIMTYRFPEWIEVYFPFEAFFQALQLSFHLVYTFDLSLMLFTLPYFCSKIV